MTTKQKALTKTVGGGISIAVLVFFWNIYGSVDTRLRDTETQQAKSSVHIERLIKSTDRIEEKIDRLLESKCD